jgi:uncharacterized membrane protein
MLATLHDLLLVPHIAAGALGLAVFWAPVLARKGGSVHRRAGAVFVACMGLVTTTAIAASALVLFDPLAIRSPGGVAPDMAASVARNARLGALFLLLLSLLVLAALRHGMLALRARRSGDRVDDPVQRLLQGALLGTCAVALWAGLAYGVVLLALFAVIGTVTGVRQLRDTRPGADGTTLLVAHFRGLLVAGIGAHTAFLVFGGRALFEDLLPQSVQLGLWVAPSVIGALAIHRYERRYRDRRGARGPIAAPGLSN